MTHLKKLYQYIYNNIKFPYLNYYYIPPLFQYLLLPLFKLLQININNTPIITHINNIPSLNLNNIYLKYHTNPTNTLPYFPFTTYTKHKHNLSTLIKYKLLKLTKFNNKSLPSSQFNTTYLLYTNIPLPLFLISLLYSISIIPKIKYHTIQSFSYPNFTIQNKYNINPKYFYPSH